MKKNLLKSSVLVILFLSIGLIKANAQIAQFDANYCYQIIINDQSFALGIPEDGVNTEQACLQQQEIDAAKESQLWKLELLDADNNIYHIVNLASNMALGASTWRVAPEEGSGMDTPTSPSKNFSWNGNHKGVVQRVKDSSNPEQQWTIANINDLVYNVKANFDLDSAKYWNFWSASSGVALGSKNIVIFPTSVAESERIGDPAQFYAYYFTKTSVANPDAGGNAVNSLEADQNKIYSYNGAIKVEGNIQNKEVEVYSTTGRLIHRDISTGAAYSFHTVPGLYIVKVGKEIAKVNVK